MPFPIPSRCVVMNINHEQRLYVIPCGGGYTCLGFDVCERLRVGLCAWLGLPVLDVEIGTQAHYDAYTALLLLGSERNRATGERCNIELTPQLIGLEGKRVRVVDCYGETRRFTVGKSLGWMPCHLELSYRLASGGAGGFGVTGAPFQSVEVIR